MTCLPPQGAPQGGLSCPFGAIHLQGDRKAVEGVCLRREGHSPVSFADSPRSEGAMNVLKAQAHLALVGDP